MGKASRTKRERREDEGQVLGANGALPRIDTPREKRQLPIFWIIIGLLVVGGLAALILTAPDKATKEREAAALNAPVNADVKVEGRDLPSWGGEGKDKGIGKIVPAISGTTMKSKKVTFAPNGKAGRAFVVLAHWCPHCNNEVPKIVEWAKKNPLGAGVEIVGISTAADKGQINYPPAQWLARENWKFTTLADDEIGTASKALGVEGYPFIVFTDKDGKVVQRFSGEMPIDDFAKAIDSITVKGDD